MKGDISSEEMISLINFLLETPMFKNLEPSEIKEIIDIVEIKNYSVGEVIFREGEPGDAWYVVYHGEVEVLKSSDGGENVITPLGSQACFGEIAILDRLPRSATVRASQETEVLLCPQATFRNLLDSGNLIAYKLVHNMALWLAKRQREDTEQLSKLLEERELADVHEGIREIVGDALVRE